MGTQIYKVNGKRVPSVTTITKLFGNKDALIAWANNQGLDGITLAEARQSTATPGSMTHDRVDRFIKKQKWNAGVWRDKFDSEEAYQDALLKSEQAFANFKRWAKLSKLKLLEGEVALVSEKHMFGGTLDAIATDNGVALSDWKTGTSGSIYVDFLYQLAGYAILWEENFPDHPLTDGFHIVRFNRESADFSHWHFGELDQAKQGFLMLREMYEINKQLQKRVR